MPRFSRRRYKRKPKARKRIDKVQNKRLSRLEESIEKKFAIHPVRTVGLTSQMTSPTAQIFAVLPDLGGTGTESSADPLLGNQVSLKSVQTRFTIGTANTTGSFNFSARVIFFWNICPRTWSTSADTPTSTQVTPSWHQLLNNVVLDGSVGGQSYNNTTTCLQQISKSNKSPIVILSDKVYRMNGEGAGVLARSDTFKKHYKSMKLTYNNIEGAAGTQPVNRQLYMAVIVDQLTAGNEPDANLVNLAYSTVMHYTDA